MKIQPDTFSIQDYLNQSFACECGKAHHTSLKHVVIGPDALQKTPEVAMALGAKKVFVVSDVHTHRAAAAQLETLLVKAGLGVASYMFEDEELVPDESALGRLLIALDPACDLLIGVGTGSINDLCKFTAFKTKMPYCIVATAPSMDGFASSVALLIVNNLKTTYEVGVADAIIGDTKILSQAPMPMIMAGIADILGKYTCLTDWKMAQIINGEYYCEAIVQMVRTSLRAVAENLDKAAARDATDGRQDHGGVGFDWHCHELCRKFPPGLGQRTSHFALLGDDVPTRRQKGRAAWHQSWHWNGGRFQNVRLAMETPVDFAAARQAAQTRSFDTWAKEIRRAYPDAAEGVLALERETGKNSTEGVLRRIDAIEKHFADMKAFAQVWLPKSEEIRKMLASYGAPVNPHEVGISAQQIEDGVLYAKELRNRYGLLQILFDLGLLAPFATRLAQYFEN